MKKNSTEEIFSFPAMILRDESLTNQDKVVAIILYSMFKSFNKNEYTTQPFTKGMLMTIISKKDEKPSRQPNLQESLEKLEKRHNIRLEESARTGVFTAHMPTAGVGGFSVCGINDAMSILDLLEVSRRDKVYNMLVAFIAINKSITKDDETDFNSKIYYGSYGWLMSETSIKSTSTINAVLTELCRGHFLSFVEAKYQGTPMIHKKIYSLYRYKNELIQYAKEHVGREYSKLIDWTEREEDANREFE